MGKIEMMMKISCSVNFEWNQVVIHQAQCNFTIHTYFLLDHIISKSSKLKEEKTNSAQFTQSSCHNRCHCHCHLVTISFDSCQVVAPVQLVDECGCKHLHMKLCKKRAQSPNFPFSSVLFGDFVTKKLDIFSLQYTELC